MLARSKDYRLILREELEMRCGKNPRYSLRAFARDLGITSSRLSEVLSGRYGLSRGAAQKVAQQLGWSDSEVNLFCDLVDAEHARAKQTRESARARLASSPPGYQQLTLDAFQVISDWYHYAILELVAVEGFVNTPRWIAQRLNLSDHVVIAAVERLKRLELLEEKNGRLVATDAFTATPSDMPSSALKKFHQQLLEKALTALHLQSVEERDITHLVLAVDRAQLKDAKETIRKFRRSFDARYGRAQKKNSVYCLGITLFKLEEN